VGETTLSHASQRLGEAESLTDIFEIVRRAARGIASADGATVVLREGENCFYADEDAMSPLWKGQRFPLTDCISGWAMLHDEVAVVPDITGDDRIPLAAYKPTFVKSLVMIPMGDPAGGAIGAYWAHLHTATPAQVDALRALAAAAATALERVGLDGAPFTPSMMTSAEV
jgi:GAF domain-containing protein